MAESLRTKIVRLAKAAHSQIEIATWCMVRFQVVRDILAHDALVPAVKPTPKAPPVPAAKPPVKRVWKAVQKPSRRLVETSKAVPAPRQAVADHTVRRGQAARGPAMPATIADDTPRPTAGSPSRILSEKPPRELQRPPSISEQERQNRAEMVRQAIAEGRVTRLPSGSAAGLSKIETQFHAAPLAREQMKGSAAWKKRVENARGRRTT